MKYIFLKENERFFLLHLGEALLGISQDELGSEFTLEADQFIANLEDYLRKDIRLLMMVFNSRITSFLLSGSLSKFTSKSIENKQKYYRKWLYSRIPLLRTGGSAFKAICGWSHYGTEASWKELNYPGKTIGREDITPTLLEGKSPWKEVSN